MAFHVGQRVPVHGYEGLYSVSPDGTVFSERSQIALKGSPIPAGYLTVALYKDGVGKTHTIHRLVCQAFHENPEGKPAVNHINGVVTDNRVENLEWCTYRENTINGVQRGTITGFAKKVPESDRAKIRARYRAGGISLRKVAAEFGITKTAVRLMLCEDGHLAPTPVEGELA